MEIMVFKPKLPFQEIFGGRTQILMFDISDTKTDTG